MDNHDAQAAAISLVHLFRDCVECFGVIHQGKKEWDRPQRLLLTKLGIEQARLLAWGSIMGVCEFTDARDARLDDAALRNQITTQLRTIIDRPHNLDRTDQFDKYGLKPSKKLVTPSERALDFARLEAFREQYATLDTARSSSITATHWQISDNTKFQAFINDVKICIDQLILLMQLEERVDTAVKSDIKALGWHPVFETYKAAHDSSKLRLIKEACAQDYPQYSAATEGSLAYLNKQWQDSYTEAMERMNPQQDPSRSKSYHAESQDEEPKPSSRRKQRHSSFFGFFRGQKWKKQNTSAAISPSIPQTEQSADNDKVAEDSINNSPSVQAIVFSDPFMHDISKLDTIETHGEEPVEPVSSMVSRRDHFRVSI